MMISKLIIRNYQSHKKTVMKFHPGVNAIIGTSDRGKSTILRTIRWVGFNKPIGSRMCSHWGGTTKVKIRTNKNLIERHKDKSKDLFFLNGQPFKATRGELPEEISKVLNLDEVSIQRQIDPPYLLDASAIEVAQHFNKLTNLNNVDEGMRRLTKWHRDLEQRVKFNGKEIESKEKQLQVYKGLDELDGRLTAIEHKQHEFNSNIKYINDLSNLLNELTEVKQKINEFGDCKSLIKKSKSLLKKYSKFKKSKNTILQIQDIVSNIKNVKAMLKKSKKLHANLESKFKKMFPKRCPLCGQEVK